MNHDPEIYRRRRQDLTHFMRGGAAILPTAPRQIRNGDVHRRFRPDSDFYYLTHFPEPEAVAVLAPNRAAGEFILFCRPHDADQERWEGRRAGLDGAVEQYGADQSFPIQQLDSQLPKILAAYDKVFALGGRYAEFDGKLTGWLKAAHAAGEVIALEPLLHEMRLIKKRDEQKLMRRAAQLTARAHQRAMRRAAPGKFEYQIQAELECEFCAGGGAAAYPSIVAGGANACILHYTDNRQRLRDGDLLLIDAGAELDCYGADVTRTFPVNGKFSAEQRAIYEVVLAAQTAAIAAVQPDASYDAHHRAATDVLIDGLVELKILRGERNELAERGLHRRFTLHRTGHWLGMDVHDVGDYQIDQEWRLLEPGMVLTVEPGLYISPAADVDARWHNIGVRIEDDILVTRAGAENLSIAAPKTIADIERWMAAR